jgi:superfamily II DNA/RNA helicase
VIDEVDTLIDSGNEEYLGNLCRAILKKQREVKVGPVPRILLVGATCTGKFERFATSVFGEDIKYLMEKNSHMHLENLTHEFIHCRTLDKTEPLLRLLGEMRNKAEGVLIFCNSISSCQVLYCLLI